MKVFDIGVTELGDPFIVMELLTGENLSQVLAHGRLASVGAVQLLLPVAEALVVAHTRGVVHRDLKPGNVFLSSDGQVPSPPPSAQQPLDNRVSMVPARQASKPAASPARPRPIPTSQLPF